MSKGICKYCNAPILWIKADRYIDCNGNWSNSRPLEESGNLHNCPRYYDRPLPTPVPTERPVLF